MWSHSQTHHPSHHNNFPVFYQNKKRRTWDLQITYSKLNYRVKLTCKYYWMYRKHLTVLSNVLPSFGTKAFLSDGQWHEWQEMLLLWWTRPPRLWAVLLLHWEESKRFRRASWALGYQREAFSKWIGNVMSLLVSFLFFCFFFLELFCYLSLMGISS